MRRPVGGIAQKVLRMAENRLKTCARVHQFYKSSECLTCPTCAVEDKPESGFLSLLSAPARRAFAHAGISTLAELIKFSEKEILSLHGLDLKLFLFCEKS